MDMSVTISPAAMVSSSRSRRQKIARGANASDLDAWLEKVEALGELKRITAEVDPDLEAATITYLVGSEKSPALLFENIKGHPGHKALYNMIGCNLSRFCLMIGEQPVDHPLKAVQTLQRKARPQAAAQGGRARRRRSATRTWSRATRSTSACFRRSGCGRSTAACISAPATRWSPSDPETGRINVGTYRMMIKGPREVGVYTSPGKDATIDREKWWKLGKPMPIAAAYGIDPLLFLVAATSLPKTESEYEYYSGIDGAPIEVFTSDLTGLPLPARAEIVLEGFLYPDETFAEGPFGEFTGYYGRPSGATPYMRVERVRYRDNPDAHLRADGGRRRQRGRAVLGGVALRRHLGRPAEARRAGHPRRVVDPGGRRLGHHRGLDQADVCRPCAAGDGARRAMHRRRLFRQIRDRGRRRHRSDQRAPGAVGDGDALAPGAVDRHPARDLEHLSRSEPQSAGDPAVGIEGADQRLHGLSLHQEFSKRTKLSKEAYDNVVARWQELGLAGTPPVISVFEDAKSPGSVT